MKLLAVALIGLVHVVLAEDLPSSPAPTANAADIDPLNSIGEEEFEDVFDLPHVTDPVEKARREAALRENEESIKKENEEFNAGNSTWFEAVNEFANLPEDEFEAQKTGAEQPAGANRGFGRGLIIPTGKKALAIKFRP